MRINFLSGELISKIVAGEIISRPSYVLKELLENSCDASSTNIYVYIENSGINLIKVVDNGSGIYKDDLFKSILKNTTSKISVLNDLSNNIFYGFRGEALFAIEAISFLEIISKPINQDIAWVIDNKTYGVNPSANNNGTTVIIRDLFYNYSYKKKILKTNSSEFTSLYFVFKCIALCNFNINFFLFNNNILFKSLPSCDDNYSKLKRIELLCGKYFVMRSIYLDIKEEELYFFGLILSLEYIHIKNNYKFFFINKRMVNNSLIHNAVKSAYKTAIGKNHNPSYCLYLEIKGNLVDININSRKDEVVFMKPKFIYNLIYNNVLELLLKNKFNSIKNHKNNLSKYNDIVDIIDRDYVYIDDNIKLDNIYINKNKVLTLLHNKIMFFEYKKCLFFVDLNILRKKIIIIKFLYEFSIFGKLEVFNLSLFKCIKFNKINSFLFKYNNFDCFLPYGFNLEQIGPDLILIKSVPKILYKFKINWNLFISDLLNLFIDFLKNIDISMKNNEYIMYIFIKYIHIDTICLNNDIDKYYEALIKLKEKNDIWFDKNCFEITYEKVSKIIK